MCTGRSAAASFAMEELVHRAQVAGRWLELLTVFTPPHSFPSTCALGQACVREQRFNHWITVLTRRLQIHVVDASRRHR